MGSYRGGYVYRNNPALLAQNAAIMAERGERPHLGNNGRRRALAPCGTESARRRHRERRESCADCGYTWTARGMRERPKEEW